MGTMESGKEYIELSKQIDEIVGDFLAGAIISGKLDNTIYDPYFKAFNNDCAAHLNCHLALIVDDCFGLKIAFIMGMMVADKRGDIKKELQELYNLYNKEE